MIRDWEVSQESLAQFVRDTAETPFFFEKDVEDYIETLYLKGLDLLYADKETPDEQFKVIQNNFHLVGNKTLSLIGSPNKLQTQKIYLSHIS